MIVINETNGGVSEVTEIETTDTSAPNSSEYDQRDDSSDKDDKLMDIKFTIKWVRLTIVMAFTALFALLSISYISNNGKLEPETIFRQNPFSFILFLLVLMVAFFFAINGVIFSEKFPTISRVFTLVALTGVILSFTVLLWALLPPQFSWAPWIFFIFTFGSLLYICGHRQIKEFKGPDELC